MSPCSDLSITAGNTRCPFNSIVTVFCVEGFGVVLELPEILPIGNTTPPDILDNSDVTVGSQRPRDLDVDLLSLVIRCAAQQHWAGCRLDRPIYV